MIFVRGELLRLAVADVAVVARPAEAPVVPKLLEGRPMSLAERIRAIAADPTPEAIATLPAIAVLIDRLEIRLDEFVHDAQRDADAEIERYLAGLRAQAAERRRGRLRLVVADRPPARRLPAAALAGRRFARRAAPWREAAPVIHGCKPVCRHPDRAGNPVANQFPHAAIYVVIQFVNPGCPRPAACQTTTPTWNFSARVSPGRSNPSRRNCASRSSARRKTPSTGVGEYLIPILSGAREPAQSTSAATLRDTLQAASSLRDMMEGAAAAAAASGQPMPRSVARSYYRMTAAHVRAALGLPPLKPRQPRPRIGAPATRIESGVPDPGAPAP